MGRETPHTQGVSGGVFSTTEIRPYLPVPGEAWLTAGGIREREPDEIALFSAGESSLTDLTGQEFLRFRGVTDAESAHDFATAFSLLGIREAADPFQTVSWEAWPLWYRLLTHYPESNFAGAKHPGGIYARLEPFEDWARQAGLMQMGVGLLGLLDNGAARRSLLTALGEGHPLDELGDRTTSWPLRHFVEGVDRSGLRVEYTGGGVEFWPPDLGAMKGSHESPLADLFDEYKAWGFLHPSSTTEPFLLLLHVLINPWVEQVRGQLQYTEGRLVPGTRVPSSLLGIMWLQLVNAYYSSIRLRVCEWDRCPGPPERPGVFLWRWGKTPTGVKHRDSKYCHPLCMKSAGMARTRKSPGYQRRAEERGKR